MTEFGHLSFQTYTEELKARGLEKLINRYTTLVAQLDELETERAEVLDKIRGYGLGDHNDALGRVVHVRPPNRKFNAERAALLLPEEVRAKCVTFGWDAKMIKGLLTEDQLDACFEEGVGQKRVIIE